MATTARSEDPTESVRVLVVDPSETAAGFVTDALTFAEPTLSVEAEQATDDALERLESEAFDCVVCEYTLDDGDGVAFLERARDVAPGVRGIVHTIADDPTVAERAWESGFAYTRKGHDLDRYDVIARHILGTGDGVDL